jgi:hypothetical protein
MRRTPSEKAVALVTVAVCFSVGATVLSIANSASRHVAARALSRRQEPGGRSDEQEREQRGDPSDFDPEDVDGLPYAESEPGEGESDARLHGWLLWRC